MAVPPKFVVSSISQQFTHEWHFFSALIQPFVDLAVTQLNPRRYAVGFMNNDVVTVHLCTLENSGVLGISVKPDENLWLNIKEHAHLPQLSWIANGTSGSERLTVLEVLQTP